MNDAVIELKNVQLRRDKVILHDINWKVQRGENWVILGLNGSGKTTLLNMVTGYLWPSEGEISVFGHKFGTIDLRELRKRIGWVSSSFQERLNAQELTQNIVVSGKFATVGLYDNPSEGDYAYAQELMERLGCMHIYDRRYQTCSQGEKQKLLIARALMSRPELLILDEPCNGLDFLSREQLLMDITRFSEQQDAPTLLFVTHHIEEVTSAFSNILLLREGTVYRSGKFDALVTQDTMSDFFQVPLELILNRDRAWLRMIE